MGHPTLFEHLVNAYGMPNVAHYGALGGASLNPSAAPYTQKGSPSSYVPVCATVVSALTSPVFRVEHSASGTAKSYK